MSLPNELLPVGLLGTGAAATEYTISRSLRFNSADSAYLSRTPSSVGNRKTWTWAGWVKRSGLSANGYLFEAGASDTATGRFIIRFSSNNTLLVTRGQNADRITSQLFRDVSAWGHIVVTVDTTQSTANDRIKVYYNGVQITVFSSTSNPAQNDDTSVNSTSAHAIGRSNIDNGDYFNGYLADIHFIDGQALDPTSFGKFDATTGVWTPKAYTGSYGTNGFKLNFSNNASTTTISQDASGNNNHWTSNNISVTAGAGNDSLVDVPVNGSQTDTGAGAEVRGNYCTWNPLDPNPGTLSNGNLDLSGENPRRSGTIHVSTGKWYFEFAISTVTSEWVAVGNQKHDSDLANFAGYRANGTYYNGSGFVAYGASYTSGDIISVALNLDGNTIEFFKNGVSQGSLSRTFTIPVTPVVEQNGSANFGQRPFTYTAPSGFKALNTASLPTPTIVQPSSVFDVKLYTGTGSTQTISGLAFSPDLVWTKGRSVAELHLINDSVRGVPRNLYPNLTNAEDTTNYLSSLTSDGFTVTNQPINNSNNSTYVAWAWDAGSTTVTDNTGTIQSSRRTNASAGFSIVTFSMLSGTYTVGHGLNVAPSLLITKGRTFTSNWWVYHASLGSSQYLGLNSTAAASSLSWGSSPTSSVFTANNDFFTNGQDYVVYAFAPIAGYSAFGRYTGNGDTSGNGPFVYCGFRPRFILVKQSSASGQNWWIIDSARDPYNFLQRLIYPNTSDADTQSGTADFYSNGFKLRTEDAYCNASGATYVYAAFAEAPFNYARAR